jgi:hypothetical protein
MRIPTLTKRPDEMYPVGLHYTSPDLDEGEKLVSATVEVKPSGGSLQLSGLPVIEPDIVSQFIYGGTDGEEYYVIFHTLTSVGHNYTDAIFVKVRDY